MKNYLLSLAAGVLFGVIYGLLNIRSPAPPVVALVGLFGIGATVVHVLPSFEKFAGICWHLLTLSSIAV